jgi:NOL1/NOP2/fmu family ribosome biogenesis protein
MLSLILTSFLFFGCLNPVLESTINLKVDSKQIIIDKIGNVQVEVTKGTLLRDVQVSLTKQEINELGITTNTIILDNIHLSPTVVTELNTLIERSISIEIPKENINAWSNGIAQIENSVNPIGDWIIINFQENPDVIPAPPIIIIIGDVTWYFEDTDGDGEYDKVTITINGLEVSFNGGDLANIIESLLDYLLELLGGGN